MRIIIGLASLRVHKLIRSCFRLLLEKSLSVVSISVSVQGRSELFCETELQNAYRDLEELGVMSGTSLI